MQGKITQGYGAQEKGKARQIKEDETPYNANIDAALWTTQLETQCRHPIYGLNKETIYRTNVESQYRTNTTHQEHEHKNKHRNTI